MLTDIDNPVIKFKIMKSLLSNILTNTEVTELLQEYIDSLEEPKTPEEETTDVTNDEDMDLDMPEEDSGFDLEADVMGSSDDSEDDLFSDESSDEQAGAEQILPSPADLGVDMTVNN